MPQLIPARLSWRINLSLLVFIIVLAAATAGLVFWGFHRSQGDASQRSREGLETQGRETLRSFAEMQSLIGQLQFAPASEFAQQAARYIYNLKDSGATVAWDSAVLQRGVAGTLYDPNPARKTNVVVQPWATLNDDLKRDLRDSAALDAILPTLFADDPGRVLEPNFRPIAAFYVSPGGAGRYYPPLSAVNDSMHSSSADLTALMSRLGPTGDATRTTVWTSPYQDESGRGLVIRAYVPAYEGTEFRGVVGVDLSMERLTQQVNEVKPTPGGFSFYVDRDGQLLHSDAYETLGNALASGNNPALTKTFEAMKDNQRGVTRVELGGREFFIAFSPFASVGGSFALAAPVDEITTQAEGVAQSINSAGSRTIAIMLLTMTVLFVGALLGTAWLNRRVLLQPISELVRGTRAVAAGNLDATIAVRSKNELGDLATSFNRMTMELRQRNDDLRREITERALTAAALSEREQQYRSIFESASDAIFITDMDDRNVDANPAACAMHGYTLQELRARAPFADVDSALREQDDYLDTLRAGREYNGRVRKVRKDGSAFLAEVHATPFMYQGAPHILLVTRDVTEQVEHEQLLEKRVDERTHELATLLDLTNTVASTLDFSDLLGLILDQIQQVVPYTGASILVLEGDQLVVKDARGPLARDSNLRPVEQRFPISGFDHILQMWNRGEVSVVDDVRGDGAAAEDFRKAVGPLLDSTFARVVSWLGVPMMRQGRLTGMLALSRPERAAFTQHEARLALALANQAAIAIENALLYREAGRRASEMAALSAVSSSLNLQRPLKATLDTVAERVVETTRAVACSVTIVNEGGGFDAAGSFGLPAGFLELAHQALAGGAQSPNLRVLETGQRRVVHNVRAGTLGNPGDAALGDLIRQVEWDTMVIIPMAFGGEVVGTIEAFYRPEEEPDDREVELIEAMTRQAATSIENTRLFAQTERRVRQLEALGGIASSFTFEQPVEAMLSNLAEQVVHASSALACTVTVIEADATIPLRMLGTAGMPAEFAPAMERAYALGAPSTTIRTMADARFSLIHHGRATALADGRYTEARELVRDAAWDTLLAVPIVYRGRPLGVLVACYDPSRDPGSEEIQFIEAIGDQAAIAIENARLFSQASAVAALEERQRLARELHDSVSQALYGIALGARTARRRLGAEAPPNVAEPLDYVLTLAEAGLTEMRALIFELRPESLESEGLVAAIKRQAAATQARYGVITATDLPEGEPDIPLAVKEAVYRIAQESLHNTVKHARASNVSVRLITVDGRIELEVRDDGLGFDPDGEFPGHLGLRSMRERAAGVGGKFEVESAPGKGTLVRVEVPVPA